MIVVSLTNVPPALRGDLTLWLLEIDTGVFVGNVSARVRDQLWERITQHVKVGRAIMVFRTNTEQKLGFYIHNAAWEPVDFDGMQLIRRPAEKKSVQNLPKGFSKASKFRRAKFARSATKKKGDGLFPDDYVIIDLETTGLNTRSDRIIEIGALKIHEQEIVDRFNALIRIDTKVPGSIVRLTGITDDLLQTDGRELAGVLREFLGFIGELPLAGHGISFDYDFLRTACKKNGIAPITNRTINTLTIAKKVITGSPGYKLTDLANFLQLEVTQAHRSLPDCELTKRLTDRLIELVEESADANGSDDAEAH